MYYVFDCTRTAGNVLEGIPFKWLAVLVCEVLTKATGRFHDYEEAAHYGRELL